MKYNIREKKEKAAVYRTQISGELVDSLYEKIMHKMVVEKKFHDPHYTAALLAKEIGTNTRYISAVMNLRFQMNFSVFISGFRIREAIGMLTDKRHKDLTMDEIAQACGFLNRQTFYAGFFRATQTSPKQYQRNFYAKLQGK